MTRRNLAGKIIPKAKYGAVGKTYNYRVDVDQNTWAHFADETTAVRTTTGPSKNVVVGE